MLHYTVTGPRLNYRPIRASDAPHVADCFADWQSHRRGGRWSVGQSFNGTQGLIDKQARVQLPLTKDSDHSESLVALHGTLPVGLSVSRCTGK